MGDHFFLELYLLALEKIEYLSSGEGVPISLQEQIILTIRIVRVGLLVVYRADPLTNHDLVLLRLSCLSYIMN